MHWYPSGCLAKGFLLWVSSGWVGVAGIKRKFIFFLHSLPIATTTTVNLLSVPRGLLYILLVASLVELIIALHFLRGSIVVYLSLYLVIAFT